MDESNLPMPEVKPGFLEWLADKFGLPFALPKLALPQTIKNTDKALARLIAAGLDNAVGRIERNTALRAGRTDAELEVIKAAAGQLAIQSKTDPYLAERALEYAFGETVLKQKNREQVGRLALEHLNTTAQVEADRTDQGELDAQTEIDDDWLMRSAIMLARNQTQTFSLFGPKSLLTKFASLGRSACNHCGFLLT